ncbi:hypothetical protein FOMPIDRAFT_98438 [Fomitopsis schrenkii]|uniref:Uncharacterized protein n=1 Tax=Fomitopsis schrenkii TaxID=2126942 RepID=S8EFE4_FOMSC|nr:hypothetical protein FOMPIDRAFT_98438 [Fomitopsis schrenkii]
MSCATTSTATFNFFAAAPAAPHAFNLFVASHSPRDTYATYEDLRQIMRPSNTDRRKRACSEPAKAKSLRKLFGIEIDLENLLRERDAQVAELTDEITNLRHYLSTQPPPSVSEPVSLPPALVSVLLPHIRDHASSASGSVTAALTQRCKTLQEENDELYELLKAGETGKLKEDVRALRRVVQKLEGALKESHQVIASLSAELEKSNEALVASSRQANMPKGHSHSHSPAPPRNHYPQPQQTYPSSASNGSGKLPPTGPRAHKKPRLSGSHASPAPNPTGRTGSAASYAQSAASSPRDTRDRRPESIDRKPLHGVEMDEGERSRPRSPDRPRERERDRPPHTDAGSDRGRDRPPHKDHARGRDRPPHTDGDRGRDRPPHADKDRVRDRERDRDREKNRERERDRDKSRRNGRSGGGGGGGRRSARGQNNLPAIDSTDRTLAERMGL